MVWRLHLQPRHLDANCGAGLAFLLALDQFLGALPIFLFALIGGVVADRVENRKILLASQSVR